MRRPGGKVYLVGAGPGRAELLTIRGAECLAEADVVLIDSLVNRRLLEHGRPEIQVVEVGKCGHHRVFLKQPAINRLLVRYARSGKTVVRLKGGDPYFFGRGGEEAEYLRDHEVPFEVVPGVSSVTAVPAYAGVPITHRGHTSTVTVVTGHGGAENTYLRETPGERRKRLAPAVEWEKMPKHGTLVILMGVRQLPDIVRRLRAAGWSAHTPVAVSQWGTWPFQKAVEGRLKNITAQVSRNGIKAPAVIVAGSVVKLRKKLNWYEKLPLFGKTVVVTRAASQAGDLTVLLERRGAHVLASAAIQIKPLPLNRWGRLLLRQMDRYDGVLFTSANAVRVFAGHWISRKKFWPMRVAVHAVGPKTAHALVDAGFPVHRVAEKFVAESLVKSLGTVRGMRFLFPRAEAGRDVLIEKLTSAGARVDLWPLYRTRERGLDPDARRLVAAGRADIVAFTSSSTVHSFLKAFSPVFRKKIFEKTCAASIGPVTTRALRSAGVRRVVQAGSATIESLVEAIVQKASRS